MGSTNQLAPGMTITLEGGLYRIESCVKVQPTRGQPFVKAMMRDLRTDATQERNFKVDQVVEEVALSEKQIEFLYPEGKEQVFLNLDTLDLIRVPTEIVGDKARFLKEGTPVRAVCYGDTIFSLELPQFLELMVTRVEEPEDRLGASMTTRWGILETGARIEVPLFIEAGDIVKCDTISQEYIQRV